MVKSKNEMLSVRSLTPVFYNYGRQLYLLFSRREGYSYLLFFLAGFLIRSVPELITVGFPVGYETINYYAPALVLFQNSPGNILLKSFNPIFLNNYKPLMDTFRAGPVFYIITFLLSGVSGLDAFTLLKITAPLLYGFLATSFFVFVRRGLNLNWRMAFLATLIMVVQLAALRTSWDRQRVVLALIFLFLALTSLKLPSKYKPVATTTLGVLTVLSRDYIGFVFIITILGYTVLEKKDRLASLIAATVVAIVLALMFNPVYLNWNYFSASSPFALSSYWFAVRDSLTVFAICYLPLIPLVVKGFWRDSLLTPLVGWLLLGSFSVIITPWFAIPGYERWLLLFVFPFSVFAAAGLQRLKLKKHRFKVIAMILSFFIFIGAAFSSGLFSYTTVLANSYMPTNMLQSSIQYSDIGDIKEALTWLNRNVTTNSTLLAEERFYGLSIIYLETSKSNITVTAYGANTLPYTTLNQSINNGWTRIYLIWYTNQTVNGFETLYSINNISILLFSP